MSNGQRQNGSIVTAEIADGAVTTPKIADKAVTYAKIQDVSATDRLLGRVSSGSGVVEEVVLDTDGTLAANSDDRVSTQKAVKTYVDAAVAGVGGNPTRIEVASAAASTTFATAGTANSLQSVMIPLFETATYRLKQHFRVVAQTNNPTTCELRTQTSSICVAILCSASPPTSRTLIAANTQVASHNKGSAYAAGDMFTFEGSDLSINANEIIKSDTLTTPFMWKCNGTGATINAGASSLYVQKQ